MATKQTKPTVIDVRKSGPLGYKALQYANQMGMTPTKEAADYIKNNADYSYMPYQQNSIEATQDKTYTPSQLGIGEDIGSSMYDLPVYNAEELKRYQNIRGEEQPWYAQAAAGIAKGGVLAGTTFVDGTVGLVAGIGTAIGEGRISGIWDNPVTQAMAEVNQWSEEAMPNYYTDEENNSPWYTNLLSANTIFDKGVKNLGFMVGAAYSGGVYSKLLSYGAKGIGALKAAASALGTDTKVTKELMAAGAKAMEASNATRATKSVVGSFMNAEAEGTTEAVNNSNDWVKKKKQDYDELTASELQKAQEEYMLTRGKSMVNVGDGKYMDPAYIKYKKRVDELQKAREAAYAQIDRDRTKMGNADLIMNLPILFLGDMVTFGKAYAGGWKAARNQMKTTTKATKEALKAAKKEAAAGNPEALQHLKQVVETAKKTGYQGLSKEEKALVEEVADKGFSITSPFESIANAMGPKAGIAYAAVRQPLKEGNEEMLQAAASRAAGSYYQDDVDNIYSASLDPDAKQKTLSWMSSIGRGLKDEYTDINNYEEGFIGALTGALGAPTFSKSQNSTDQTWLGRNKFVGLTGGVVTEVRDYLKDQADEQLMVEHINKTLHDPNFKNRFNHFVAQTKFDDVKKQAVVNDDQKAYKDAETASIFEDVMYFKKGNRLDLLQRALDNTELFDENDIQDIINQVSSQRSAVNASINSDIAKKKEAETKLEQAKQDLDTRFGNEAHQKALDVFYQMGGPGNEKATTFYNQFIEGKRALEQNISSLQQVVDNYDNRINNSSSIEYSPFMKSDGTIMSDDEVKEDIQKRVQHTKDIIEDISKAQDEIDNATGGAYTDEQLTTLTWYKVMMRDWEKRAAKMAGGIKEFIQLAVNDPVLANTLKAIQEGEKVAEDDALYGGFLKYQKNSGEDILNNILGKLVDISPEEANTDTGKAKLGIALAQILNSDTMVPIITTRTNSKGETVEETKQQKLGEFVKEKLSSFINDSLLYSEDQKAPFKKAFDDLVKIGDNYSQYEKLLQEYRKNPEKIEEAHVKAEDKASKAIYNKNAKTIAERFDWNAPIGDIVSTLRANQGDIKNNMGSMEAFIQSLPEDKKRIIRNAQKMIDAIDHMHDQVDSSDMEDRLKTFAHRLIDEAGNEAEDFQKFGSLLKDSLDEGAIKNAADQLFDADDNESTRIEKIQIAEEDMMHLFDDGLKSAADAFDKMERQQSANDEERRQNAASTFSEAESKEAAIPNEEDAHTPNEEEVAVPNENADKKVEESDDGIDYIDHSSTNKDSWDNSKKNDKSNKPITEGTPGYENKRQITEYYLNGFDGITYIEYLNQHPEACPKGVDKEAFKKYVEATYNYLKDNGAYIYIKEHLAEGDKITFTVDPELNKKAGVPVVLMTVESKTEKNEDGTPKTQVIGSIRSELDFQAYEESIKKYPKKKSAAVEAQRELFNFIIENNNTSSKSIIPTFSSEVKDDIITYKVKGVDVGLKYKSGRIKYAPYLISKDIVLDAKENPEIYKTVTKINVREIRDNGKGVVAADVTVTMQRSDGDTITWPATVKLSENPLKNNQQESQDVNKRAKSITTTVKQMMYGDLPRSTHENTLSEIFKDKTPIIGVVVKDSLTTGSPSIDKSIQSPISPINGQIYVAIPTIEGKYIPALCYSKSIEQLIKENPNDWYIQNIISAMQRLATVDDKDFTSAVQEVRRWLPLNGNPEKTVSQSFKINRVRRITKEDGSPGWEDVGKGQATAIHFKYETIKDGKVVEIPRYMPIKDGKLSTDDIRDYIKRQSREVKATTSINKNMLSGEKSEEYKRNMARYISTNMMNKELGQHTINDWFLYEKTDIEKQYEESQKHRSPISSSSTPPVAPTTRDRKISYKGATYNMDEATGVIRDSNNNIITDVATINGIKESANLSVKKAEPIDLGNISPSTFGFLGYSENEAPVRLGRRPRGRRGKALLATTRVDAAEEMASKKEIDSSIKLVKKLFPKLDDRGRLILHHGIINTVDNNGNPVAAFGMFKNGILYISDVSPKGAAFHEAFHYLTDFLLDDTEREQMFAAAREQYGNLDELELEEKLAEDFRHYVNGRRAKSWTTKLKEFFKNLWNVMKGIKSNPQYLDILFNDIYSKKFANRQEQYTSTTKNMVETSQQYEQRLQDILSKAPRDKDGKLLVKNKEGKLVRSNLNERQYAQVRTSEFKEWFGDWENDPENASKVTDENGEPLVVYHGTNAEFDTFDFAKLGEATGQGQYTDHLTGAKIPIDSSSAFFFTNNRVAAFSYAALSRYGEIAQHKAYYKNILAHLTGNYFLRVKLDEKEKRNQEEFMRNILSPIFEYDLKSAIDNNLLSEQERQRLITKITAILDKIDKIPDSQSISNQSSTLKRYKEEASYITEHRNDILNGVKLPPFERRQISFHGYKGNKESVYISLSYNNNNGKYEVVLPESGRQSINLERLEQFLMLATQAIEDNEGSLKQDIKAGKYDKTHVLPAFLNIRNPFQHDYKGSAFPDYYLKDVKEGERGGDFGNDRLQKRTAFRTAYIAARQVKQAKASHSDGVVYRNIKDPFTMDSYGIFDANQVKSATENNGRFSKVLNNTKYMKADTFKKDLMLYKIKKFSYKNLGLEEKEYLKQRKISEEEYSNLSTDQQEILLHCM